MSGLQAKAQLWLVFYSSVITMMHGPTNIRISPIFCVPKNSFFFLPSSRGEGKAIPLQVWTIPEGSRRPRFKDFMTIGT